MSKQSVTIVTVMVCVTVAVVGVRLSPEWAQPAVGMLAVAGVVGMLMWTGRA